MVLPAVQRKRCQVDVFQPMRREKCPRAFFSLVTFATKAAGSIQCNRDSFVVKETIIFQIPPARRFPLLFPFLYFSFPFSSLSVKDNRGNSTIRKITRRSVTGGSLRMVSCRSHVTTSSHGIRVPRSPSSLESRVHGSDSWHERASVRFT